MKKSANTFYCFSPPVMLATYFIETILFVYTVIRYKMSTLTRIAASMLALLAIFQLAEFNVCGHVGSSVSLWSRTGYVAITLLPALGIHLIRVISGRGSRWLVTAAYASSLTFAVWFGFSHSAFQGHVCAGNYAIFQLGNAVGSLYFAYYYFWLLVGIGLNLYAIPAAKRRVRQALALQVFGYLSFLLPTGIVNAVNPQTIEGIPSVMCGFAVIYALLLTFGIVPLSTAKAVRRKAR